MFELLPPMAQTVTPVHACYRHGRKLPADDVDEGRVRPPSAGSSPSSISYRVGQGAAAQLTDGIRALIRLGAPPGAPPEGFMT